jgi:hypothetical protein
MMDRFVTVVAEALAERSGGRPDDPEPQRRRAAVSGAIGD